ncbi:hypothetical protein OPQ81_006283 [Rhizoctonia solani]|nr:hypothetical protein OPQ81_006283 [Rhizoctonia solani]
MVLQHLFLALGQLWLRACVSASLRLTFQNFLIILRTGLNAVVWRLDEYLDSEKDLVSKHIITRNQPWSDTTLLTSEMQSDCIAACLAQHGCKDITDRVNMRQNDRHVFTRGGFGTIYRGVLDDGQSVAIKCIESFDDHEDPEHGKNMKRAAREIYVWSHCNHQGILPVLGFARYQGQMALIAPWRDAGPLKQHILRGSLRAPLRTCIQLVVAVEYLHMNGIVHGDIKPDNDLITDQGEAQLADFGSATLTRTNALNFTNTNSFNFTIRFAAPEVLGEESRASTKESDIYALGMVRANIMSGQLPFSDKPAPSFINAVIIMKEQPPRPNFDKTLHGDVAKDEIWNLLRRCLTHAPKGRPKVEEVKGALIKIVKLNDRPRGEVDSDARNDFCFDM